MAYPFQPEQDEISPLPFGDEPDEPDEGLLRGSHNHCLCFAGKCLAPYSLPLGFQASLVAKFLLSCLLVLSLQLVSEISFGSCQVSESTF